MGKASKISWLATVQSDGTVELGATWNPWVGCYPVETECAHCYAARWAARAGRDFSVVTREKNWERPLPLQMLDGKRVFVCSLSDFFHHAAEKGWRDHAWDVMRRAGQHTYLIPTKRPENIERMLPDDWGEGWENVVLLVSAGTTRTLWRHWIALSHVACRWRGVSMEPLLERVDMGAFNHLCVEYRTFPDWVIVGGESGPERRPMDPAWAGEVRDWCVARRVPFFFKGHVGDKHDYANGLLDGRAWQEYPVAKAT